MNEIDMGLIVAAALYGLRHGCDFDHLAAIADLTGSAGGRRRALRLSGFYVAGHASAILVLGVVAVGAGAFVPASLDATMGRVIGLTLIGLGIYLAYAAVRYRSTMRFRSRWMLAADGVRVLAKLRERRRQVIIEHSHPHSHDGSHEHDHDDLVPAATGGRVSTVVRHAHTHTHVATMPADPFEAHSSKGAFGVGIVHGFGAETPSQILLFATAAGAGSLVGGTSVLLAFLVGLVTANTAVAVATATGFAGLGRMPRLYVGLAVVAAVFSLSLGVAYLLDRNTLIWF